VLYKEFTCLLHAKDLSFTSGDPDLHLWETRMSRGWRPGSPKVEYMSKISKGQEINNYFTCILLKENLYPLSAPLERGTKNPFYPFFGKSTGGSIKGIQ